MTLTFHVYNQLRETLHLECVDINIYEGGVPQMKVFAPKELKLVTPSTALNLVSKFD